MNFDARNTRHLLWAAAAALAVAGCGGGSGSASTTTDATSSSSGSLPPAASQSVAALVGWASSLPPSDVSQPLATDGATLPVDDAAQPLPI
jgi:hypothetical protein